MPAKPRSAHDVRSAVTWLTRHGTKATRDAMLRFGIPPTRALGVTMAQMKMLAGEIGRDHALAAGLWGLTTHDKLAPDTNYIDGLALIERAATDDRHFVKKAVNMALRAIGKRNTELNSAAVTVARRLAASGNASAMWIGKDALRELQGPVVARRIKGR